MNNFRIGLLLIFNLFFSLFLNAQAWQGIGPFNRANLSWYANGQGSGIINTIAFHPKYNTFDASLGAINKTIFTGSPYGGIWISRDAGANWSTSDPLLPSPQYPALSTDGFRGCGVVDIAIDYTTPTTLYAAFSSLEFAEGYSVMGNYYPSTGIYKYTPLTGWQLKKSYPYQSNHCVAELEISPTNPSIIFACTDEGVIKSTDAGNTWSAPIVTEGVGKPFRNLVFDPTNSNIVFASGRDVYKSTDGGSTFTSTSNFGSMIPNLVKIVQTNIAVISSTAVYATVVFEHIVGINTVRGEQLFRYNGSTWSALSIFPINKLEYHYDRMPIAARKVGTIEYVFAGSEVLNLYNSSNPPTSRWTPISDYNDVMHADIHDIVFSPDGSTLMVGHDGGLSIATSGFYTTPNWVTCNNGLNISTIISFSGSQKDPAIILVGEHDNGNSIVKNATSGSPTWKGYMTCDGGDKMTSPYNINEWYDRKQQYGGSDIYRNETGNEAINGDLIFSSISPVTNLYEHTQFEEFGDKKPMVMDPNNSNILYKGSNILLRSMDKGATSQILFRKSDCFDISNYDFHSYINSIAIAPSNSNYLYINFINPYSFEPTFSNHIYKTTTALTSNYAASCLHSSGTTEGVNCNNWTDITPNFGVSNKKSIINSIVVSDKDPNVIWAGFSCNKDITPASNRKNYLVWKYDGTTWTNWGAGLPDNISITSLVYERGSNDGIYAGTDVAGVFYRSNTTGGWISYGSGMPHALINQLEINNSENTVRAGTYGRGIWKNSLYCPTLPYASPNPCSECNTSPYFWEGTSVTIENTTLSTKKQFVRAVNVIDILPNTTLTASANVTYDLYIHGCGPFQYNSYRKSTDADADEPIVINTGEENEDEEKSEMSVFPNPNSGIFTLNTDNTEEKDIYVYDVMGKIVYEKYKTSQKIIDINIATTPKGIYLIKVVSDDKIETLKVINQ